LGRLGHDAELDEVHLADDGNHPGSVHLVLGVLSAFRVAAHVCMSASPAPGLAVRQAIRCRSADEHPLMRVDALIEFPSFAPN
jgi:hypothetical protein